MLTNRINTLNEEILNKYQEINNRYEVWVNADLEHISKKLLAKLTEG